MLRYQVLDLGYSQLCNPRRLRRYRRLRRHRRRHRRLLRFLCRPRERRIPIAKVAR